MTIKEVEERTGMTRANVRFYEQEGLLSPDRAENGYRDYSEDDVAILKRIKLLRNLHMSLDGIKEIHYGKKQLKDALRDLMADLEDEQADAARSQDVCRMICGDGVQYSSLDAQHYLDRMEREGRGAVTVPEADVMPRKCIPGRRFFARIMDFAIYSVLWKFVLAIVFHANIIGRGIGGMILDIAAVYALMLSAEPLFLAYLGTTPGKWILGIGVMHSDERRLTPGEAFRRTRMVCFWGMGLSIPFYKLYRNWRSCEDCWEGKTLAWEGDSVVFLKDERVWRTAAYIVVRTALAAASLTAVQLSALPLRQGRLTVADFCENYNHFAEYYRVDETYRLDENGSWEKRTQNSQGVTVELGNMPRPEFIFMESGGEMTGMEFTVRFENGGQLVTSYPEIRALAVCSFVKAQDSYRIFSAETERLIRRMAEDSFESYSLEACGISVDCGIEYSGYEHSGGRYLIPEQSGRQTYSIHFVMKKKER